MRKGIVFLVFVALFVTACGPKSLPPIVDGGVVNEEQKRQQELVLKDYIDRMSRVDRVSFPLLTRNLNVCESYNFLSGMLILDRSEVYSIYREAAKVIMGIDDKPRIVSVRAGSPAAKAGLQVGDIVLAVQNDKVSSASSANRKLRNTRIPKVQVERAGQALEVELSQDRACDYPVIIWEEPTINAYATGSKILVTSGMIKFCKTDDELALVLGHEMAHNHMSHISSKMTNGLLMSFLIDGPIIALTGVNPGIGRAMGENMYSQGFETEADYVGLYNTARAGYDINGVADLWRRMAVEHPGAIYTASTHPTTANRFVVLEAAVKEIKAKRAAGQALEPNMQPGK